MNNDLNSPTPLKPIKPTYKVTQVWSTKVGSGSGEYKLQPAYSEGKIYSVDTKGNMVATNAKTGNKVWSLSLGAAINAGTDSSSQYVAAASRRGELYVINATTGKLLWKKTLSNSAIAAPKIWQQSVIVKTIDGSLAVYNAKTGIKRWSYDNGAPDLVLDAGSMPQVAGNTVVAGFDNGHILGFNLSNGNVLWNRAIAMPNGDTVVQQLVGVDVTPVIQDGSVYAAAYQGSIVSLNLVNGRTFWQHKMSSHSGLAVGPDRVFISSASGIVWAYDSVSGGIDWQQDDLRYRDVTGPAVMGKTILVADAGGSLNWLSKSTGAFVARASARGAVNTAPLVADNTAYVLSTNGYLSAYKLS
jgi:outer membrane protein assembly factor BamB